MKRLSLLVLGAIGCGGAEPPGVVAAPAALAAPAPAPSPQSGWIPFRSDRLVTRRLGSPPMEYTLVTPAPVRATGPAPELVKILEEANQITDTAEWLRKNALAEPISPIKSSAAAAPSTENRTLTLIGRSVLAVTAPDGKLVAVLDFELYAGMDMAWAEVEGDVLYVSHRHMGYAATSGGLNAYITALDVRTGKLFWRSAALVSNTRNFLLRGAHILTGYGFTAEPDFLYVLDRSTGKTVKRIPLRSGPEVLIEKDGKLFVRTYDANYVFELR